MSKIELRCRKCGLVGDEDVVDIHKIMAEDDSFFIHWILCKPCYYRWQVYIVDYIAGGTSERDRERCERACDKRRKGEQQ